MADVETARDYIADEDRPIPSERFFQKRIDAGWKLTAVEWQRPTESVTRGAFLETTEIPYGLRVANDCHSLEEDPVEVEALTLMLEMLVEDQPFSLVAEALNTQGLMDRQGNPWTQVSVFQLVPRMVEVGSDLFQSAEWSARRRQRKGLFAAS